MRRYETIVIADPDLSDEKKESFSERIQEIISQQGGFIVEFDVWGNRKLAYEIRKKSRGHYIRIDYCGTGEAVNEMERFFRIDDRSMKYMTILLNKDADIEAIKEIMAAKEADEKASASESEQTSEKSEQVKQSEQTSEKSEQVEQSEQTSDESEQVEQSEQTSDESDIETADDEETETEKIEEEEKE